jgi:succinate dehydrogenase hydrophobic anchor subunit
MYSGKARSDSRWELYAWFFMRIAGVFLLLTGAINLIYINLAAKLNPGVQYRWVFFPVHGVGISNNRFVALYGFLIVAFALTHGMNGWREVMDEYVQAPGWRLFWRSLIFFLWAAMLIMAFIISFGLF